MFNFLEKPFESQTQSEVMNQDSRGRFSLIWRRGPGVFTTDNNFLLPQLELGYLKTRPNLFATICTKSNVYTNFSRC